MLSLAVLLGFTAYELTAYKTTNPNIDAEYERNAIENPQINYFAVNRDYMPLNALVKQRNYLTTRGDKTLVLSGSAKIEDEEKDALHIDMTIRNAEKDTRLELPYLFYPGYTVIMEENGKKINLQTTESENGFVQIVIPEYVEEAKIVVDYTATTLEKVAYIISGISIVCFIAYVAYINRYKIKKIKNKEEKNETKA